MSHLIRKRLPEFSVYGYQRGESRLYTREDLLGHWSILYFYPAAWQPGAETLTPSLDLVGLL